MQTHVDHKGFHAWILNEESFRELYGVMTDGLCEPILTDVTFMCARSVRKYSSLEEFLVDENQNEDPIQCIYIDVTAADDNEVRLRNVVLHHIGIYPASPIFRVEVIEGGKAGHDAAHSRKEALVRVIRRMKPWWSYLSGLHTNGLLLSVLLVYLTGTSFLLIHDGVFHHLTHSNMFAVSAITVVALYFGLKLVMHLMKMESKLLFVRLTLFPLGVVTIGEGKSRLCAIERAQNIVGRVFGAGLAAIGAATIALFFG